MRSSALTFLLAVLGLVLVSIPVLATDSCICPAGQQGNTSCTAASPNCGPCSVTTYKPNAGGGGCFSCPAGSDSRPDGLSCRQCTAGQYYSASAGCVTCAAGSANPTAGSSSCPSCMAGYYQPNMGQSYCIACPAGTAVSTKRATQCYPCGANQVAPEGSAQCTTCPSGQQPNKDKSACVPNPSGTPQRRDQHLLGGAPDALFCPAGFTSCPTADRLVGNIRTRSFECVNTAADVESCGGCVNSTGGLGEDCTLFDPLAAATCVKGKCQYKCPRGYKLTADGCERLPPSKRSNAQRLTSRGL